MLTRNQKIQIGERLAAGHRRWGRVAMRRAYREEDDEGGSGVGENLFQSHPMLADQPVGASSDLTAIMSDNAETLQAAEERQNEASLELQPTLEKVLQAKKGMSNTPTLTRS